MTRGKSTAAVIFLVAFVAGGCDGSAATGQGGDRPLVSQAEYDRWLDELSNWGRWGPDDEMGALNLITPEKRRAAAGLVTEGLTVHLLDRADFDDLAAAASERNRWEFMLTIAPLPIPNGTASPVNPIATF